MVTYRDDIIKAARREQLALVDKHREMLSDYQCPYCDSSDGMGVWNAQEVDDWMATSPATEYEKFPYYCSSPKDRLLCSPCGYCNYSPYIPKGYHKMTFGQVQDWLAAHLKGGGE